MLHLPARPRRLTHRLSIACLAACPAPLALAQNPIGFTPAQCDPNAPNSTGAPATIAAFGSQVAMDHDVRVVASNVPPGSFGYFLGSMTLGYIPNPAGSFGAICVLGNLGRYNGPGQLGVGPTFDLDVGAIPVPTYPLPGAPFLPGDTWYWQAWYRDAGASNFTNVVGVAFDATCGSNPVVLAANALGSDVHEVVVTANRAFAIVRATTPGSETISFYELEGGTRVASFASASGASGVRAIAAKGGAAIVVGDAGPDAVQIFEYGDGVPARVGVHALTADAYDVDANPSGHALVRAHAGQDAVTFYDLSSGARIAVFSDPSTPTGVRAASISGLVTGSAPDQVRVFQAGGVTWQPIATQPLSAAPHDVEGNWVRTVAAGPDAISRYVGTSVDPFPCSSAASGVRSVCALSASVAIVISDAGPDAVQVFSGAAVTSHALSADGYDVDCTSGVGAVRTRQADPRGVTFYSLATRERLGVFASSGPASGAGAVRTIGLRVGVVGDQALQVFELGLSSVASTGTIALPGPALDLAPFGTQLCPGIVVRTASGAEVFDLTTATLTGSLPGPPSTPGRAGLAAGLDRAVLTGAQGPDAVTVLNLSQ